MSHPRSALQRRINRQRVMLWYASIRHLSNNATSYALEKQLVAEGFHRAGNGVLSHRNRMARYAQGKHVPRRDLVRRAEVAYPGSQAMLEHPYWRIIDPSTDLPKHGATWLNALGPDIHRVLFRSHSVNIAASERCKVTRVTLQKLERVGSFEALAVTAFLLREALADQHHALAIECARTFWILLLIVGSTRPFLEVVPGMCRLAGELLLDKVSYQGEQVALSQTSIETFLQVFSQYRLSAAGQQFGVTWRPWACEMHSILRGSKGFNLAHMYRLPTREISKSNDKNSEKSL